MTRLDVQGISKAFSGVKAVQNVSLKVDKGEIVSMIGPNGAGKTTIFNLITGIYPLDAGHVFFEGQDISGKPQHVISRLGIARTFQNIRLFQGMSVLENGNIRMRGKSSELIKDEDIIAAYLGEKQS